MARFLDTNVLLRYLTRDDEEKAAASLELLQRAQRGEEKLVTSDLVIAELVWVRPAIPTNIWAYPRANR